jgi:hypothetical protein
MTRWPTAPMSSVAAFGNSTLESSESDALETRRTMALWWSRRRATTDERGQ